MESKSLQIDRRRALKGAAALSMGAALAAGRIERSGAQGATPVAPGPELTDDAIFTFVLNLEYLEAEYYLRGTTGKGLSADDIGAKPGDVTGGAKVPFKSNDVREFAAELAADELAHVRYYRKELGAKAIDRPAIDLAGGFAAVAKAAGLGTGFDPFANEVNFLLGGMLFEDVGVIGYHGATTLIKDKERQADIAGVLAVEAYHMGMARSQLFVAGTDARKAANAITAARGKLNGKPEIEQGIEVDGKANVVPADDHAIAFTRTPQQVLQIAYVTSNTGVSSGGFFPNGVNGDVKTT